MTFSEVCNVWDSGFNKAFSASYGRGTITISPFGPDDFHFAVIGHETQGSRTGTYRGSEWYARAAANGDFEGMSYHE